MFSTLTISRQRLRFQASKRFELRAILIVSLALLPFVGLVPNAGYAQRRGPSRPRTSIVQVTLHADLKETYTLSSKTGAGDSEKGSAELTMTQDFTGKYQMEAAPDGTAGFTEAPDSPGVMSGSFHYQGQDESHYQGQDGPKWYSSKEEVAGSLDPLGEVDIGGLDASWFVTRVHVHSDGKVASCDTKGNSYRDPHECWGLGVKDYLTLKDKDSHCNNGPCATFDLWYELHPSNERSKEPPDPSDDYVVNKKWYGLSISGNNSMGYELAFDRTKSYEDNSPPEQGGTHHERHEKRLAVGIKIKPTLRSPSSQLQSDPGFGPTVNYSFVDWAFASTKRYDLSELANFEAKRLRLLN